MLANYGEGLGCEVDSLLIATNSYTHEEITDAIMNSDLIYVGGGNTAMMMEIWRQHGVDILLKEAYDSGIVLSGLSAGSICWFEYGHSDAAAFEGNEDWKYIKLEAMGLLRGIHCPHYDEDTRAEDFMRMVQGGGLPGIAVENNCAIIFKYDQYKVISTKDTAKAYTIIDTNQGVTITELAQQPSYKPLSDLY